jgi:hypothetical protein
MHSPHSERHRSKKNPETVSYVLFIQIILLLFRHRSFKEPFRQGEPTLVTGALDDKALGNSTTHRDANVGGGTVQSLPEHPAAAYLPVLHSDSPLAPSDDSDRGRGLGPVPSLAYPKAVYLGSSRTKTV